MSAKHCFSASILPWLWSHSCQVETLGFLEETAHNHCFYGEGTWGNMSFLHPSNWRLGELEPQSLPS